MGVVNKGKQTQIVIGTDVANVYKDFIELTGLSEEAAVEENLDDVKSDLKKKKGNLLTGFFETIAGIFNPIVPALAGAGLVRAILTIAVVFGLDLSLIHIFNGLAAMISCISLDDSRSIRRASDSMISSACSASCGDIFVRRKSCV